MANALAPKASVETDISNHSLDADVSDAKARIQSFFAYYRQLGVSLLCARQQRIADMRANELTADTMIELVRLEQNASRIEDVLQVTLRLGSGSYQTAESAQAALDRLSTDARGLQDMIADIRSIIPESMLHQQSEPRAATAWELD